MFNYDTIIKQIEAMNNTEQQEFAEKLLDKNSSLAVGLSTLINIAHQDKFYTDSEAMEESLKIRGHVDFEQGV